MKMRTFKERYKEFEMLNHSLWYDEDWNEIDDYEDNYDYEAMIEDQAELEMREDDTRTLRTM